MGTTFKAIVIPSNKRKDGTYRVTLRICHNGITRRIPTQFFVRDEDLVNGTNTIKNQFVLNYTHEIIGEWRKQINKLDFEGNHLSIDEIIKYLLPDKKTGFQLDFLEFGRKVANSKSDGTRNNYISALNCLIRFLKHVKKENYESTYGSYDKKGNIRLDISEITAKFLLRFEEYNSI